VSLEHGSFADGTPLQSPLHVLIGAEAGPVLYVQAAVHGDEVNGVETVRRVVTSTDPEQMRGILLAVPIKNGPGFVHHQRRNPFDKEDMNRIWPGKADGMISQHMAYNFYQSSREDPPRSGGGMKGESLFGAWAGFLSRLISRHSVCKAKRRASLSEVKPYSSRIAAIACTSCSESLIVRCLSISLAYTLDR
jgi:predicted deacylase